MATSSDRYLTLDAPIVNSMSICGSVTPSRLNAITFVTVICPRMVMTKRHRFVYIYQALESCLHVFELEVLYGKLRARMIHDCLSIEIWWCGLVNVVMSCTIFYIDPTYISKVGTPKQFNNQTTDRMVNLCDAKCQLLVHTLEFIAN